jgi:RNA polymerase sigma factor (sigma-70 family)
MQQRTGEPIRSQPSFAELYQRHAMTLLNYIQRYVSTREDAEDVLVEAFLAAYKRGMLAALSEDEQLAWLRRVAYNKCVDILRRQQRHPMVSLEKVEGMLYEADEQSPERIALRMEEHSLLWNHLAELTAQQQTILHLKFGQKLSGAEIARRLNKSESTISTLLSRTLNQLRELYRSKRGDCIDE